LTKGMVICAFLLGGAIAATGLMNVSTKDDSFRFVSAVAMLLWGMLLGIWMMVADGWADRKKDARTPTAGHGGQDQR
jgi:hypothetical protein